MGIGSWTRLSGITEDILGGDLTESFIQKSSEIGSGLSEQKIILLNTHLGIKRVTDWIKVKNTPYEWAIPQIQEFLKANDLRQCELMSLNDMVFVFGQPRMKDAGYAEEGKYIFKISLPYAVFKKSLTSK